MIKAIMAFDSKHGVGRNGTLPWPANKEDLKQFKEKTIGSTVIMGSNTWNDPCFPAPLKHRENIVISSKEKSFYPGADIIMQNINLEFIKWLDTTITNNIWIIGGPSIIKQCEDIIEEFHITEIPGDFDCDTFLDFDFDKYTQIDKSIEKQNIYYIYRKKGLV